VDLGGDEGDQGRDRGEGGAGGGRFRAAGRQGAGDRAGPGAQGDAGRQREGDDHGQVLDHARRGEAGVAGFQGQDRGGQGDRGEGGADQHARRDGGLAAGQGGRGDRRDLARGQAGHQDAVAERAGRHQVRDRPGQGREHGDPGEDRHEDAPPGRREAAQRLRVDRDRGGEDQDDEQRVDALVSRQPGEGTLDGKADDRRGQDGGEFRVRRQPLSRRRQRCDHGGDHVRSWGNSRIRPMTSL
jgi:hypothetical protein